MDQKLAATPQLSPDRYYWWTGDAWVPAASHPDGQAALAALASVPEQAASSEAVVIDAPPEPESQPEPVSVSVPEPESVPVSVPVSVSEPKSVPEPELVPEPAEWTKHPATAMTILPGLVPTTAPPALVPADETAAPTESAPSGFARLLGTFRR